MFILDALNFETGLFSLAFNILLVVSSHCLSTISPLNAFLGSNLNVFSVTSLLLESLLFILIAFVDSTRDLFSASS